MVQRCDPNTSFAALADPTRRGILEHLVRGPSSVSELAERFAMTLTGVTKHIGLLEQAGMVVTEKQGRVRQCRLGSDVLAQEMAWMHDYRDVLHGRLDRLEKFLD